MQPQLVTAPRVVSAGRTLEPGWVLAGETVYEIGGGEPPRRVRDAAGGTTVLDEGVLAPGLVDAQVNGGFGTDLGSAGEDEWLSLAQRLPSTGVTAFVPTLITAPLDELAAALRGHDVRRRALGQAVGAARVLGLHLEGPFLAPSRRGAHCAELLCDPTPARVEALLDAADGSLAYVTLAPERDGAVAAVERFVQAGVRVAVGHTDADEATVRAAADAGASLVTHLYNAQRPLHHRDPGTVGAALTDERLACGLILDLHHVAPAAARVAFSAAPGRIALVTDAVAALGMPPGTYDLGGQRIDVVAEQPPRRTNGTIAGSALRMDQAVANAVRACSLDLADAIDAATRIPAAALGRGDLGHLAPGTPADMVWMDDELCAAATWIAGRQVWSRESREYGGAA